MNINERLFVAGIAVIFLGLVVFGVLIWQVMVIWLRNKREQRKWDGYQRDKDREDRMARERAAYLTTIKEQTNDIKQMVKDMKLLTESYRKAVSDYDKAKERMSKFNLKGEAL